LFLSQLNQMNGGYNEFIANDTLMMNENRNIEHLCQNNNEDDNDGDTSEEDEYNLYMNNNHSQENLLVMGNSDNENDKNQSNEVDYLKLTDMLSTSIKKLQEHVELPTIKRKADQLENNLKHSLLQHLSVRCYLQKRLNGTKKIEASDAAANEVYKKDKTHSFKSKSIRAWAEYYMMHHSFKQMKKGTHSKTKTIINEMAVQQLFKERLYNMAESEVTPTRFMTLLNDSLLAQIPGAPDKVSKETARRWLQILGYQSNDEGKRHYVPVDVLV
jgi:hypothetical protein